ncbi:PHD finger protein 12 isoform X2 [Odontomachus brunneus]|nr:PHD finger protein 12 isoform X2 [Odontomachus brunneus]XP_032668282.1 PHD finger protein 12 isoform X2 [Odontomachus brunneus]
MDKENEKKKKMSALEILAFAASLVNPREFELPKELQLPIMFPGSNKMDYVSGRRGKQLSSSCNNVGKNHCLDSNLMVPLPARLCFECGRSCRKAPLIACDYCPLYFHQDCLDPPLTTFPIGRWMCPNHPNHFIDQNLLTSCRVTERIKLWDKYANQRIDQHAVKLDFLRKARAANPLFRTKVRLEGRPRVKVPSSIKYHYENPSKLDSIHFNQNTVIQPLEDSESRNEQRTNSEQIDDSKNCELEENKTEEVSQVEIKTEENDITVDKETNRKKEINANECMDKMENVTVTHTSRTYNNLEFHSRYYDYDIKEGVQLLERPVLEILAQQRLGQILNPDGKYYETVNRHRRVRAVLFSVSPKPSPPAYMTHRTFVIGNGPNCDLVLSSYGKCDFISSKHAIIFFDEMTKRYELLNYSEYGTVVDDVLYCPNYTHSTEEDSKDEKNEKVTYITKEEETSEMIKTILHKEETVALQQHTHGINKISCKCSRKRKIVANKHPEEGWEGSAIIAHGSILAFGCLTFVFNTSGTYIDR